ncbi:catalytic domain thiamine pyrophosphokinase [Ceratobasidium sp. AG-Ba]|nr:catalytic domain thiamine pyrophosphokinase [Ceratobasidium sp. AG-Ba]
MRFSLSNSKRSYPRFEEVDKRENSELVREINLRFVNLEPRAGGGGRGGGGGGRGGAGGGGGGGSRGGVSFGSGSRGASSYSRGGGSPTTIGAGTTFAGRSIGGGSRDQVYGTSRYGSGYTYGSSGNTVAGRGFPFGYWPVFVPVGAGAGYYGYREYGPASNSSRPGGPMQYAVVRSSEWPQENTTAPINNATASFYIVGDADSVSAVMDALVSDCSVVNATGQNVDDNNPAVHVEQAVQYYRSSSFMLALSSYNNTANLASNAPTDNNTAPPPASADTPLPAGTNTTFLNCLNTTIGDAVPIMDAAPGTLRAVGGLNAVGMLWLVIWLLKMF